MIKECVICGKGFETSSNRKTCSSECSHKLRLQTKRVCNKRHRLGIKTRKKQKKVYVYNGKKQTLCWTCKNSTGGCNWSRALKPVEGWEAEKIRIQQSSLHGKFTFTDSYRVIKCPLYEQDD